MGPMSSVTRHAHAATRVGALAVAVTVLVATLAGCSRDGSISPNNPSNDASAPRAVVLTLTVVAEHPHDPTSFTEGLVFVDDDTLAESSGQYGTSDVRLAEPLTGQVQRRSLLDATQFAEGLALRQRTLVQLTWRERAVLRWTASDLTSMPGTTLDAEGWGLTYDAGADVFFHSNGTSTVAIRDPENLAEQRTIVVRRDGVEVPRVNELEFVAGQLWANVWQTNDILRIDPATGNVTGVLDCTRLDPKIGDPEAVLNGIAHRPGDPPNRLWVTGKRWPAMFEIDVGPAL